MNRGNQAKFVPSDIKHKYIPHFVGAGEECAQLRKISGSVWHRYGRLIEQNRATVLVVTPFQFVSGAACRVRLESRLGLDALSKSPESLKSELRFTLLRSTAAAGHEPAVQAG